MRDERVYATVVAFFATGLYLALVVAVFGLVCFTFVLLKVIYGWFGASKKSGERRWASRSPWRVLTLAASI